MGDLVPIDTALHPDSTAPFTDDLLDLVDAGIEHGFGTPTLVDTDGAEYTMARLARVDAEIAELTTQYDVWRERLDGWLDLVTAGLHRRRSFLTALLEAWAVNERSVHTTQATYQLPSGTVETRLGKEPVVVIGDADALLLWCDTNLDAAQYEAVVKTEQSVRISELRKLVRVVPVAAEPIDDTGEPRTGPEYGVFLDDVRVEGVTVELPAIKPTVKPGV